MNASWKVGKEYMRLYRLIGLLIIAGLTNLLHCCSGACDKRTKTRTRRPSTRPPPLRIHAQTLDKNHIAAVPITPEQASHGVSEADPYRSAFCLVLVVLENNTVSAQARLQLTMWSRAITSWSFRGAGCCYGVGRRRHLEVPTPSPLLFHAARLRRVR